MKWTEDLVAIATGVFILGFALVVFVMAPYASASEQVTTGSVNIEQTTLTSHLHLMVAKFQKWTQNPLDTFEGKNYAWGLLSLLLAFGVLLGAGAAVLGTPVKKFLKGFVIVFLVGLVAYVLQSQVSFKSIGLGYALWAIVLGIFISNTFGLPEWLKPALRHELFIKTGLVLLGAEVLFGKIMAIGLPGIFVAWVVTPIVLVSTFWFGQRILKMSSKSLNITISADMSVCGVSAAIATAAACNAKKEELTTAIGLSMVFTSVMMVALPAFIQAVGMPEVLGGAWLGGTIDATGAVVAAGAFLGDTAMNVAATIKMIQNILIGVIAFAVAMYWTTKVDRVQGKKVPASEIWNRFPKFILGFIGASIFFSLLQGTMNPELSEVLIEKQLFGFTKGIRGWLFCLAFVSIGLSTNFKELRGQFSGGKPLILYVCGQLLNLGLTLLMAWLVFYKIFPEITATI
ncbi:MAG: putative sulfate exporter family transporter [Marinoscillum sp.]|uniref:YeiH family protein n=1 Tax=Marinoscillum sp. TaxID=2024838 RepID=UPI0032F12659